MADIKEKLVELLDNSFEKQYGKRGLLTAHHTADDLIANGVTIQEWISVEERLPTEADADNNECVLALHKADSFARCWIWYNVAHHPEKFRCWMPAPEPPKE